MKKRFKEILGLRINKKNNEIYSEQNQQTLSTWKVQGETVKTKQGVQFYTLLNCTVKGKYQTLPQLKT